MTFEIPLLNGAPPTVHFGAESRAYAALARAMAANGFLRDADLRVGSGGLRVLVEKALRRWWSERQLPMRLRSMPIDFRVVAPDQWTDKMPVGHRGEALLVISTAGAAQRCYLRPVLEPLAQQSPEFVQHAIAVLYAGLDAICHAVTPREQLAFARAYWWDGQDDRTGPANQHMSRRSFNTRVAPISQAPQIWPHIVYHFLRGHREIANAVLDVHQRLDDRRLLRPNAEAVVGKPPLNLAAVVRWRHGDPAFHLLDTHQQRVFDAREDGCWFHSVWSIPEERTAFRAFLSRMEETAHFAQALDHLIATIASPAGRTPIFW